MKKLLPLILLSFAATAARADITEGNDYYRIENLNSSRYVSIVENTSDGANFVTATIDSHAIMLNKDFSEVVSDPASVLYIRKKSKNDYEISAQGITLHDLVKYDIKIMERQKIDGRQVYWVYGTKSGMTRYLADGNSRTGAQYGEMVINSDPYSKNHKIAELAKKQVSWFVNPISADSDNYLGVKPTVETAGVYWASLFASFPYAAYSPDVEFYYPAELSSTGLVYMKKVDGVVPAGMPVVVKCGSEDPSSNRLNVGEKTTSRYADNQLRGIYFNFDADGVHNFVEYQKDSMRVLGKCKDGSAGFVKAEGLARIPANTAYISVPGWYPDELKFVFDKSDFQVGVEEIGADESTASHPNDVYNLSGVLVMKGATEADISTLPSGFYIVGGKKRIVR